MAVETPSSAQEQLQARLADPRTVDSLNRLLDRVDLISASVEMLDGFFRRSSDVADNISDSVAELRAGDNGEALGFVEKLPKLARAGTRMADVADSPAVDRLLASGLLEKLSDPNTMESLSLLLNKLDLLVFTVNAADGFLRRGNEIADSVSGSMGDLRNLAASVDTEEIKRVAEELPQITQAGHELIASGLLGKVSELTEAGMQLSQAGFFDPQTVKPLAEMGRAAAESYVAAKATPQQKQYGIFDLMRLLKDPAAQKAIHVLVEMTKQFGRKMA